MLKSKRNPMERINTGRTDGYKKHLCLTGIILTLKSGVPAVYIYNGKIIKTSKVIAILEAAPLYVVFETLGYIYTIKHGEIPSESYGTAG